MACKFLDTSSNLSLIGEHNFLFDIASKNGIFSEDSISTRLKSIESFLTTKLVFNREVRAENDIE